MTLALVTIISARFQMSKEGGLAPSDASKSRMSMYHSSIFSAALIGVVLRE